MGLIDRFNHKQKLCDIGKTYRNYRYVKITQRGLEFLESQNIFEEQRNLGGALDLFLVG